MTWLFRLALRIGYYLGKFLEWLRFVSYERKTMYRIAVVGDLSLQDPARLDKVMAAAWAAKPDLIVHVGDIHPGYDVMIKYSTASGKVVAIPGNHDTEWDSRLGWSRQWSRVEGGVHLVGMDNSADHFSVADKSLITPDVLSDNKPLFIFCHKPLSTIVLSDGSESTHIMGEGSPNPDAENLKGILRPRPNVLTIHGHYHGLSLMHTNYAEVLVEGRGGAAPELGFSLICVQPEGWVISSRRVDP